MSDLWSGKGYIWDDEEKEVSPYGALNPEQVSLTKTLGPYLTKSIGQETPQYTGDFTAEYTPLEQTNLDNQSRLSAMTSDWSKYYQPGQINSEVDANEWRNLNQKFYGDGINPGAKALAEEQYAGSGGFWGTPRANAVLSEYNNTVVNPYQDFRSTALQNSYQNALNYGTTASGINQATATMAAVPRAIKQYGLEQKYNEWVRTRPESQKYIDQALNFLGISTGTMTTDYEAPLADLFSETMKIAMTAAGAAG